jgi:hypothetical protein
VTQLSWCLPHQTTPLKKKKKKKKMEVTTVRGFQVSKNVFSWLNLILFGVQLTINFVYAQDMQPKNKKYIETLITPSGYAFQIWGIIYLSTFLTLLTDFFYPFFSIFSLAFKPNVLRCCFSLTCVLNGLWLIVFRQGWLQMSAILLICLWSLLCFLYLFCAMERHLRGHIFIWQRFLLSEMSILLYFSWISCATLINITICLQENVYQNYLSLMSYQVLLAILAVLSLSGIVYAKDPIIGIVAIWALVAITNKQTTQQLPEEIQHINAKVQASASILAAVIASMLLVATAYHWTIHHW